jgi:hypothetical protein
MVIVRLPHKMPLGYIFNDVFANVAHQIWSDAAVL